jgi:neutral ceramidase
MTEKHLIHQLHCGIARADITPPVGIKSAGFAGRGPLSRLHDSLYATAIVFILDTQRIAVVSCDLLGLDADTVSAIRQEITQRTQLPENAITVACTHTHYGPDPYRDAANPMIKTYRANLIQVIGGAVEAANRDTQPVTMRIQWGESDIGINRREKLPDGQVILGQNPAGPIDRSVGVLRIDNVDGTPLACLVNFATHPVSQTGKVDHISADYPGKMREVAESITGALCLFLQGASGNINAERMEPRYEPARSLGVRLGCEVVRLWELCDHPKTPDLSAESINYTTQIIELPRTHYGSAENAQKLVQDLEDEIKRLIDQDGPVGSIHWAELRLKRAQQAVDSWITGELPEPVLGEIQAVCIGDFAFVTAPGEIFNQIGVRVKEESPFTHTWFLSCTNGSIGYVPVPEAYADGGYEVTHASRVGPEAAGILTQSCLELLQSIYHT